MIQVLINDLENRKVVSSFSSEEVFQNAFC